MSVKKYRLIGIGFVVFYKRRNSRSIKISIAHDNQVRVSMPQWMPYSAGIQFVRLKRAWILAHQKSISKLCEEMAIGKAHRLHFIVNKNISKSTSRITSTEVRVIVDSPKKIPDAGTQKIARQASIRAMRQEASNLLPIRHRQLANKYNFNYTKPQIKRLSARWGSCNHKKDITLNLYLIQLPWELIDYVIVHELVHTKILNHGQDFWEEMTKYLPNPKALRKKLKQYQPIF